ncbi:MAG: hypothetical protein K1X88_23495 [Nannocystaceae bacterium]|nr:hypothetical protein [Nannocystaceae bacterium]
MANARVLGSVVLWMVACTCREAERADPTAGAKAAPAAAAAAPAAEPAAQGKEPPLTAEEQRLIDADPKSLSAEERRARAYALRRKIMQNPDSPAARTLEDLRKAADAGQLDVGPVGPRFELRRSDGTAPVGTAPPAGHREPAQGAPATNTTAAGAP